MISMIEMENWSTTNPLRKKDLLLRKIFLPFKAFTGLKDDRKNAGYPPDKRPVMMVMQIRLINMPGVNGLNEIVLDATWLNSGNIK